MARPIKLTTKLRQQAIEEFIASMETVKMADGKISYNKNFTYKGDVKAIVYFTPKAYAKMFNLIMSFDTEVAWHGVGERLENENEYLISDILVYPQTVTGSNVEMDVESYTKWLIENCEDERFDSITMQGHSHVNFSTSPSAVDLTHQEEILSQLNNDMFYIFMIWNKKHEHNTRIYDLKYNVYYENADISYKIYDADTDFDEFISDAKNQVKKKTTEPAKSVYGKDYVYGSYSGSNYKSYQTETKTSETKPETNQKEKPKEKEKPKAGSVYDFRYSGLMDDEAHDIYGM